MIEIIRFVAVMFRLLFDLVGLILRTACWLLEHVCIGLEWCSAHLDPTRRERVVETIATVQARPVTRRAGPTPVETDSDEEKLFVKLGGRKGRDPEVREMARTILANGQRVPVH